MLAFSPVIIFSNKIIGKEISYFLYYLLSVGFTFGVAHFLRKKRTGINGYNFSNSSFKIILLVSVSIITIQLGTISPIISLIPIPDFMKKVFLEIANENGVLSFISSVIMAPVLEELIFRGIILNGLLKKYSPTKSIIISSVLFGIVHFNPWQFVSAFIFGIFSGWVYYRTKKLTLSIIIHFTNNLFAIILGIFMGNEYLVNESIIEIYGGFTNALLIILFTSTVSIVGIWLLRK